MAHDDKNRNKHHENCNANEWMKGDYNENKMNQYNLKAAFDSWTRAKMCNTNCGSQCHHQEITWKRKNSKKYILLSYLTSFQHIVGMN